MGGVCEGDSTHLLLPRLSFPKTEVILGLPVDPYEVFTNNVGTRSDHPPICIVTVGDNVEKDSDRPTTIPVILISSVETMG